MKVLLLENIKGIGRKGEVKEVSDGHARNFLIPKGQALAATPDILKKHAAASKAAAKEEESLRAELSRIASGIDGKHYEFPLRVDDKGNVFGSVNKEAIIKALRDIGGLGRHHAEIVLEHPLKEIGDHSVAIDLGKGVKAKIIVRLLPLS